MRLASVLLFAAVATATPPWQYLRLSIRYDVQADGSIRCTRSGQLALLTRSGVESFTNFAMPARGTVRMNRFLVAGNPRGPGSLQDGLWMVPVGAVKTGDAIDYEIEQTIRPAGGGGAFWFEDLAWSDAPASEGEIVLDLPAESKWKVQLLDKKQYTLETKGTRSIHTWKFGPATDLNRKPRFRMATFDSWQQLGNWVTQRISLETGPRIRALATSLGFERLHELVTQRIGLVGSPWAESGFQVRTAQDTLTRREGSALDKQRLIASLWKAAGIEAELAFVLTGDGDSTPNPLSLEKPLLVVMRGGETLWVDPADPSAMPGVLAGPLRGRSALIVGLRSRVEQIPREPPPGIATRNRASAEWHAVVRADGALEGSMHFEADGEIARNWRESEIRSTSRDWIAAGAQAATLRGDPAVSDPYDFTRPFSITMLTDSASLHRLAKRGSVPMQALVFHMGGPSEQRETIEIKLDGGFAATCSPGGRIERGYGTYLSKCELADGVVRIERTLRLTTAAEVDAGFRRAVLDDQQSRVAIRRRKAPEVERALSGMTVSELHAAASDLWMKQDLRTALRVYTRLTELHPMHAYYWSSVGRLQAALRNEEEARQALRKALELTPTDFSTHTQLISLEMRNGNYEGAAGQIRRLLKEKPGDRFGLGNLPTVLLRAGRYEEVETAINDLRLTEPNISSHRLTGLLALACQGKAPELAAEIEAIAPAGQPLTLLTAAARLAECGAHLPLRRTTRLARWPGWKPMVPVSRT